MASAKKVIPKKVKHRVVDLGSLPLGKVTIDDVIEANDVTAVLGEIQKLRGSIDGLLAIWRKSDGTISYRSVKVPGTYVIAMCEIVKSHVISREWLDE